MTIKNLYIFKLIQSFSNNNSFAYTGKWITSFLVIGIVSGIGAVIFEYMCGLGTHFFMDYLAGFNPPLPDGEHSHFESTGRPFNKWILLILPAVGGLISGIIVYVFAPEAEGHGTDSAIDAYHNKGGLIRARVPIVKTIASTITLTSGGSGGREGPIAQIGAGFGSFLATKLNLTDRERRIMMAAGIGAGVGAIFRAPLAGALFAAEVLYKDPDFESEVIIPAGIASVIGYCIFCLLFGWGSLFHSPNFQFSEPVSLIPYTILAFILVILGKFYCDVFYKVTDLFKKIPVMPHFKPAIGGLATGIIGFFFPYTLASGYGYIQEAIFLEKTILFLAILAVGKIFTTAFTIGSGGSGGVFGPSVVIGGAVGGAVGLIFHNFFPGAVSDPGAFVVVGMAGFFTVVSNTPISTIIFVSEMTNSYHLLLPSLLVCALCYVFSGDTTIYKKQVKRRVDSPAHQGEFMMDVLQSIKVKNLMHYLKQVEHVHEEMRFSDFKRFFSTTRQHYFPVMDKNDRLVGIFSSTDIRGVLFAPDIEPLIVMKDIATPDILVTTPEEDLHTVLLKFTQKNIESLPVVDKNDKGILLGMLNRREVISFYNNQIDRLKNQE
ncbi:MAG: chloride channel protein [Thermodesulfobacteriota bacterium]